MVTPVYSLTSTERVLPRLALDFTTGTLDPRVTVTRALNTATRVNSSGYIETINANLPRFAFDPITLLPRGLLIEEERTNLLGYSAEYDNGYWAKLNVNISADAVLSPDGTTNAEAITSTSSAVATVGFFRNTGSLAAGHTMTVYAKAGTSDIAWISGNTGQSYGVFNLATQTILGSANGTPSIVAAGNGWYRLAVSNTTVTNAFVIMGAKDNYTSGDPWANGTWTSGNTIHMWGAQLEYGAFPTSYIPTNSSSSQTRNSDVVTMTGSNFSSWWVSTTGAVVARTLQNLVSGISPSVQFDDATADNIIALRGNTTNPELYIKATTDQAQIDAGTIAANTAYTLGGVWDTNNCAAALNGAAPVPDTSVTVPTVTQARLGSDGINYLNGYLQTVRYWPQRITNAEIQAFSK